MTPQSVGLVRAERRLVEEFYNCPLHVNAGLILAPFLSENRRAFDRRQSRHVLEQQRIAHELPEVSQSGSASHLGDGGVADQGVQLSRERDGEIVEPDTWLRGDSSSAKCCPL